MLQLCIAEMPTPFETESTQLNPSSEHCKCSTTAILEGKNLQEQRDQLLITPFFITIPLYKFFSYDKRHSPTGLLLQDVTQ